MKKLLIPFICLVFLFCSGMIVVRNFPSSGGGGNYDDITFWWRCEGTTFGDGDYSAGDDTATLESDAEINTDAVKIGTYGLDCPTASDKASFTVGSDEDIVNGSEGRIGMWVYWNILYNYASIFRVRGANSDEITCWIVSNDELQFGWKQNGGSWIYATTTDLNLQTGTWYFIECSWDADANTTTIYVDGIQKAQNTASKPTLDFSDGTLYIGISLGYDADLYIDNVMISNDHTRDFNALKNETGYPG